MTGNNNDSTSNAVVYVIDDDDEIRDYLRWALEPGGWHVEVFSGAQQFLEVYDGRVPACIICDLWMPGLTGLDLQQALAIRAPYLPLIMISGQADVPSAVRAVRGGALDFLQKPVERQALLEHTRRALTLSAERHRVSVERDEAKAALARLTPRQHAVLEGLLEGKSSKVIADDLGISTRTVDVHRFHLMRELNVQSLSEVFRLIQAARGMHADHTFDHQHDHEQHDHQQHAEAERPAPEEHAPSPKARRQRLIN